MVPHERLEVTNKHSLPTDYKYKSMKQILQRLSAVLTFTLLSVLSVTAEKITMDSLKYSLNSSDHTASLLGFVDGIRNAKIPNTIKWNDSDYKVTSIKEECFHDCVTLVSIVIPEGISVIPKRCFWGVSI